MVERRFAFAIHAFRIQIQIRLLDMVLLDQALYRDSNHNLYTEVITLCPQRRYSAPHVQKETVTCGEVDVER